MASNRGTSVFQGISDGLKEVGKNLERNAGTALQDVGQIVKGDWNNVGNSLLRTTLTIGSFGAINPDSLQKITGDTTSERAKKEAVAAGNDQAANDAASLIAAKEAQVASTLAGIVDAQKRTPGRSQTLLTAGPAANTLLTVIGSKR